MFFDTGVYCHKGPLEQFVLTNTSLAAPCICMEVPYIWVLMGDICHCMFIIINVIFVIAVVVVIVVVVVVVVVVVAVVVFVVVMFCLFCFLFIQCMF